MSNVISAPFRAYGGDEPYIYVCYAHIDAQSVFPDIKRFHDEGFNIFYDQGLAPGSDWMDEIEKGILNASLFVVFLSKNSIESRNVINEINLAISQNIPVLPIYLEECELKYGLKLVIGNIQAILKYSISDEEYYFRCITHFKNQGL